MIANDDDDSANDFRYHSELNNQQSRINKLDNICGGDGQLNENVD